LCALNLFFDRDKELQIYHGNFLLMDNKHRKLFVIKQTKGRKFMPKMHQNLSAAGLHPDRIGEFMRTAPLAAMEDLFLRGRREAEGGEKAYL